MQKIAIGGDLKTKTLFLFRLAHALHLCRRAQSRSELGHMNYAFLQMVQLGTSLRFTFHHQGRSSELGFNATYEFSHLSVCLCVCLSLSSSVSVYYRPVQLCLK